MARPSRPSHRPHFYRCRAHDHLTLFRQTRQPSDALTRPRSEYIRPWCAFAVTCATILLLTELVNVVTDKASCRRRWPSKLACSMTWPIIQIHASPTCGQRWPNASACSVDSLLPLSSCPACLWGVLVPYSLSRTLRPSGAMRSPRLPPPAHRQEY